MAVALGAVLAALLALAAFAKANPVEEGEGASGVGATPVVANPVPQRQIVPVRGSDGRWHAMYELLLTNTVTKPAKLRSVAVIDPASGRRVATIGAKRMVAEDLKRLDREAVKDTTLPAEGSRALYVSVSFASKQKIPARLTQRFQLSAENPFTGETEKFAYRSGAVPLSRRRPPLLAPPLRGGSWPPRRAAAPPPATSAPSTGSTASCRRRSATRSTGSRSDPTAAPSRATRRC